MNSIKLKPPSLESRYTLSYRVPMDLPLDLMNEIFRRVPIKDYPKIALACRVLREVLKNENLWQHIYNQKGVKTHRDSYLDSTKQYLTRRWQWEASEQYAISENKTLAERRCIYGDNNLTSKTNLIGIQTKQAMSQTRNTFKIRIETDLIYFWIGLENRRDEEEHIKKKYSVTILPNMIITSAEHNGDKHKVKISTDQPKLKIGDIITIKMVDNEPHFQLNKLEIPFKINRALQEKLKKERIYIYPRITLYWRTCVRIIND